MRTLSELWAEAMRTDYTRSKTRYSEFIILNGYKIEKMTTGEITVYDTRNKSDFYTEVLKYEMDLFLIEGFKKGTHLLSIDHLERKLEIKNNLIRYLLDRNNVSQLTKVKQQRNEIMRKINNHYNKIK